MKQNKQLLQLFAFLGLIVTFQSNADYRGGARRGRPQQQQVSAAPVEPVTAVTPVRPIEPVQPIIPLAAVAPAAVGPVPKRVRTLAELNVELAKNKPTVMLIYSDAKECYQCKNKFQDFAAKNSDMTFVQADFENDPDITHAQKYITTAVPTYVIFDALGTRLDAQHDLPSREGIKKLISAKSKNRQGMRDQRGQRFMGRGQQQRRR